MPVSTATDIVRAVRPGPVFAGAVAVTVFGGWLLTTTEPFDRGFTASAGALLLVMGGWVISLSLHEFGHAVTAYAFGDHGVETRGYLTLNPLKYAHAGLSVALPLLMILLGGIGFPGGAVYVNQAGFTRAQRTAVSLAGPAVNIGLAIILLAVIRGQVGTGGSYENLWLALSMLALLQIVAAVLNLLPVPGFDGYGAIEPYLSMQTRRQVAPIAPYGFLILLVLLIIPPINREFFDLMYRLFGVSGLPDWMASFGWGLVVFWQQ